MAQTLVPLRPFCSMLENRLACSWSWEQIGSVFFCSPASRAAILYLLLSRPSQPAIIYIQLFGMYHSFSLRLVQSWCFVGSSTLSTVHARVYAVPNQWHGGSCVGCEKTSLMCPGGAPQTMFCGTMFQLWCGAHFRYDLQKKSVWPCHQVCTTDSKQSTCSVS